AKKGLRLYRQQQEYWLGKQIINNSNHTSPNFMIIGAAKSGTTSLFQYLAQHPSIVPSAKKEIKYFGMSNQIKGLRWYLNHFPKKNKVKNKLTFEATPTYLYRAKQSPKQIVKVFPDIKFIALLRDPMKRAFSHWTWYQKHSKFKTRSYED